MKKTSTASIFVLFVMICEIFASVIVYTPNDKISYMGMFNLNQLLSFGLPFLLYLFIKRQHPKQVLKLKPLSIKNILYIIGLSITVQPLMMIIGSVSSLFFKNYISDAVLDLQMNYSYVLVIFTMAVIPAIFEEITFRGIVDQNLEGLNTVKACLLNGLFFGMMHLNMHQFFYAFAAGVMLSYLVRTTGSILSSMLAHFTINFSQSLFYYIGNFLSSAQEIIATENTDLPEISFVSYLPLLLYAAVITGLFAHLLASFIELNKANTIERPLSEEEKVTTIPFVVLLIFYAGYTALTIYSEQIG